MNNVIKTLSDLKPTIEIVDITPDYARELLKMNTGNFRSPDIKRVLSYANDMKNGNWDLTGDTIKITNNEVVDGQHRLLAIVKAGVVITSAVAWNVAVSGKHVDKGKPRSIGQWLKHLGMKDANNIAASAKLTVQYDKGKWGMPTMQINDFSDSEVIDYAKENYESLYSANKMAGKVVKLIQQSAAAAIIHIAAGRKDPQCDEFITWFWSGLGSGKDLKENDPPNVLRERLIAAKLSKNMQMTTPYKRWIATMAWNKACSGESISRTGLRIRSVGPAAQEPPSIIMQSPFAEDN